MTAPAPPAPRTGPPVTADAFVRSRDGRAILDRDGSSEPERAFLADPDRLRVAVTLLDDLGLTVDAVDRVAVTVHGPPGVLERAFGVRLVPDGPAWRLASGGARFAVPPGSPLGGVLHSVVLTRPPQQASREDRETTFPVAWPQNDLLLGEIGQTLLPEHPARLAADIPLRLADPLDAARRTRESLQAWERSGEWERVRTQIAAARALRPDLVPRARIVEYAAHPDTAAGFHDLWPGPGGAPPRLSVESSGEFLDGWDWSALGTDPRARTLRQLFDGDPDERLTELLRTSAVALTGDVAGPIRELSALLGSLATDLDGLVAGDVAAGRIPFAIGGLRKVVAAFLAGLDAGTLTPARRLWHDTRRWIGHLNRWLAAERRFLDGTVEWVRARLREHGTMVGSAFLAVTLDSVPVELREALVVHDAVWGDLADAGPTVVSVSAAWPLTGDFTAADAELARGRLAGLGGTAARRLYVLAAGNEGASPGPVYSQHLAYTAKAIGNVLTVGGCVPAARRWTACERTHGYDASVPVDGRPTAFVLPHVCATTMGAAGGGVLHPTTPDRPPTPGTPPDDAALRWRLGSGSSLATPIVAAVCTLVWSAFPGFTAEMVRTAVLRGARRLDGGSFYRPPVPSTGITASAAPSWRACLPSAMSAAAVIQEWGLRELPPPLTPPPAPDDGPAPTPAGGPT